MNLCPARKHDLDKVGMAPPPPSRLATHPTDQGTCKGCRAERRRKDRRLTRGRDIMPTVNRTRIWPDQDPADYIDSGFSGTQQRFLSALVGHPAQPAKGKEWMDRGLCRDPSVDPELFWPQDGESGADTNARYAKAKQVCRDCYFQPQCKEYAIDNDERVGVWGGTTPGQRHVIRLTREIA